MILCNYCKKEITQPAYVKVKGDIILKGYSSMPQIFKCKEHSENYARTANLHDDCWMEVLKTVFGLEIHDIGKILAKYQEDRKELENGMGQDKTSV
jgi:CRISPR/Cas system-associated endonuclease Cas3-HD